MAPKSPLEQPIDILSLTIMTKPSAAGSWQPISNELRIISVEIESEINRIPTAKVILLDGDAATANFDLSESSDFVPGTYVKISAGYHSEEEDLYEGVVVEHSIKMRANFSSMLVLSCVDPAVKMTLSRKNKYFLKVKDSDIITQVIGDYGLASEVDTTQFKHDEVVQYHATDWDFILNRAEINGLLAFVKNGKVSIKKPKFSGSPDLVISHGESMLELDAKLDAVSQLPSVETNAWDMKTQKILTGASKEPKTNKQGNISGKDLAKVLELKDFQLHTTAPLADQPLKSWASSKLLKSRLARIQGKVTFQGNSSPELGKLIELAGVGKRFNGDAYISRVNHRIKDGSWITEVGFGMSPKWFTQQHPEINSMSAAGLLPAVQGLQNGVVKQIHEDPDGEFRILIDVPVIEPTGDGIWARMVHFYASKDIGCFFMPEVGDEVLLGFLNNDPRFPVILGMMYSSKLPAAYQADDKNTFKGLVTKSKMKIEFEDVKKILLIETPGGHRITLSDDGKNVLIEDSNKNKFELSDKGILMDSPKDIKINAKGKLDITSTGAMTLKSQADVKVEGLNVQQKAQVGFSAQGQASAELKASGQVTVKGAMVMIN